MQTPHKDIEMSLTRCLVCLLVGFSLFVPYAQAGPPRERIRLDGSWQFQLDPKDEGEERGWYSRPEFLRNSIQVPGVWQSQGYGVPRGQIRHDYQGKAWYGRQVDVPSQWKNRSIWIHIGGVLRRMELYVNGVSVGGYDGLFTPVAYRITEHVRVGASNWIVMAVDNRMASGKGIDLPEIPDVKFNAATGEWFRPFRGDSDRSSPMGVFNQLGNFGGIYRSVWLESRNKTWIDGIQVQTALDEKKVRIRAKIENHLISGEQEFDLAVRILSPEGREVGKARKPLRVRAQEPDTHSLDVEVNDLRSWSPEDPFLYKAEVTLRSGERILDQIEENFGFRKVSSRGGVLLLNNVPYYLRGYSVGRVDPIEGMMPPRKDYYLKQFRLAKSYGFNHVRYHSWVPFKEAFDAADEAGIFIHAELAVLGTGWLMPNLSFHRQELQRILKTYYNHPSFLALDFGNELKEATGREFRLGRGATTAKGKRAFLQTVKELYDLGKSIASHILIMANSGHPIFPADLMSNMKGYLTDVPTVKHESGGYKDSLPDIDLVERFGGILKADLLAEKRAWIEKIGLMQIYPALRKNSERLQQMVRKWHFETVRRVPELCGYEYWLLIDSPPSHWMDGWEDGLLNYFGEPKAITTEEMGQINAPTVLLISAGVDDRTFWADRGKKFELLVSHYASENLHNAQLVWKLKKGERILHQGTMGNLQADVGQVKRLGTVSLPPVELEQASKLNFWVELKEGNFCQTNEWSFWAFPRKFLEQARGEVILKDVKSDYLKGRYPFLTEATRIPPTARLVIASRLDWNTFDYLRKGGRVFLMAEPNQFDEQSYVSYFPGKGDSVGTFIDSDHPALAGYPHDSYCDLQFYRLQEGGSVFRLTEAGYLWMASTGLGEEHRKPSKRVVERIKPIIWGLRNKGGYTGGGYTREAWLFESRAGKGQLLMSTLRLRENLDDASPEAVYLFDRLLRYALSDKFHPRTGITEEELSGLLSPRHNLQMY